MRIPTEGKLLRIFIGEADKWEGKPLYEEIVIEMVDGEEKISAFLPRLDAMVKEGLITLEKVHVEMYRAEAPKK